ncbi:MAG: ABC transporter ATP-binding protein [Acidimicrobiales bacterium]|nr:ABC transporter ATP-binding protein [Acidimicrobiales bacterium]
MPLLDIDGITVRFGGHIALDAVSIPVEEGTLTGLIGPNGAGKTTLFNVVTGLQEPTTGNISFAGTDITKLKPHKRARLGIARTFQRLELFTSLSVRDNVRVAGEIRNRWGWKIWERTDPLREADEIIERVGLSGVADQEVAAIPTGQARVVELARSLMTHPRFLLLDEPASGQDEQETEAFGRLLRDLVADGMTIFLVEHDMSLVMQVCDTLHVLDFGSIIARGTPAEIQTNQAVLDAYLGAEDDL